MHKVPACISGVKQVMEHRALGLRKITHYLEAHLSVPSPSFTVLEMSYNYDSNANNSCL